MARCRADWRQVVDPETGHWCWYSQLRQESRWEKPSIRTGWMEWRDANGNAFYVDDAGLSTWDPPWADDTDEAPETTREAPDLAPPPPAPPPPPVAKTDVVPRAPRDDGACWGEGTYAPPRAGTDLLAYERRRAAALVAAYREQLTTSRERRLRDDREALARDRAALDRERQLLALERLRGEHRNLPARSAVAALIVSTGLARNQ